MLIALHAPLLEIQPRKPEQKVSPQTRTERGNGGGGVGVGKFCLQSAYLWGNMRFLNPSKTLAKCRLKLAAFITRGIHLVLDPVSIHIGTIRLSWYFSGTGWHPACSDQR